MGQTSHVPELPKSFEIDQFEKEILKRIKDTHAKNVLKSSYTKQSGKYHLKDDIDDETYQQLQEIIESNNGKDLKDQLEEQISSDAVEELTVIRQQLQEKKDEIQDMKTRVAEYENLLKRKQAEFENYKKRTIREREDFQQTAHVKVIEEILPIVDNFEKAIQSAQEQSESSNLLDGIILIEKQLKKFLENNHVEVINCVGEEFDPHLHEALQIDESNKEHSVDTVIIEWQKGYTVNGKVLRHSKVVVAKGTGQGTDDSNS